MAIEKDAHNDLWFAFRAPDNYRSEDENNKENIRSLDFSILLDQAKRI